jgi:putative Holliday junction resolvase
MPVGLLKDMCASRPYPARLMGVDFGTKTIGLAISNADQTIATPLQAISRTKIKNDMQAVGALAKAYDVGGYVFGWPLHMDGSRGASCDRVMSFIDEMSKYPQELGITPGMDMWIALWDERLSTSAVDNFLIHTADISRKRRRDVVDKLAAQHILQGALDSF